ncbi:hypothetical protein H6P81_013962 [Aristolochia fimbriata]|uniref:Dynein light chain n=1 Tax=Aristolochia fimbriata TaxID=158543 RepID=A0AAV7EHS0_ARIFI|nr:hypothetical protein H6P81_013962 [Aristolochia fimbriata]
MEVEKSDSGRKRKEIEEHSRAPDAKVAAMAASLGIQVRSAEMSAVIQERAFRYTAALLAAAATPTRRKPTDIAFSIKKEFDAAYGPAWHCVVGKSFGSFVTHSRGGFLYFSIGNLSFLLFKTAVRPVAVSVP